MMAGNRIVIGRMHETARVGGANSEAHSQQMQPMRLWLRLGERKTQNVGRENITKQAYA
jgi:hypothetical protein